ncbi:MAG: M28 family peptidase [Bacteroidia bacterium]|nr:MAG: M28 family peptidase [Bacteroidia bacterium]
MNKPLLLLLISMMFSCQPRFDGEITVQEIEEHIAFLASEELKGRYPGTPEDQELSEYIAAEFRNAGLDLYEKSGIQAFDIVTELELGPGNSFLLDGSELSPGSDFTPFSFSGSGSAKAEVVFAGYGFQIEEEEIAWSDYKGVEVSGKWVMLFRGVPGAQEASSPYVNYSEDRGKALLASDRGVAGVIFVSGSSFDPNDQLEELKGKQHALSIPVVHVGRETARRILESSGSESLDSLESAMAKSLQPSSFATGTEVDITVDLQPKKMITSNVIASLKGSDPALKDEYVIIGAHHDHLGMGGPGSSSRAPDTVAVHYGADDNASGVAGVLEISEFMSLASPARSMVFATFGAEELGLVGSMFLSEHSPVDMGAVQAMINLDMIGRLNEDRQLQVGGIGTSPGFRELLDSINSSYGFNLQYSNEGYGPSDHATFYAKDVPVLFISTGAHPDYHTPGDQLSAINLSGAQEVMLFAAEVATALANQRERIAFTEAGPKVRGSSRSRRGGITLGLMPDVSYDGSDGMPVMFVTEGKPTDVGGIQKGDIVISIEGKNVGNVYDYMSRLEQLKEGMDIVVTVKRGEDLLDLVIRI